MKSSLLFFIFATLFLVVSSLTVTSIASPYIVLDLGGDRTITNYGLSFFGLGTAITIPLTKPIAARIGEKTIFPLCLLLFSFASLLCALAPTYFLFLSARFLAGMVSGPFYPLIAHYITSFVPPEKRPLTTWIFVTILVVVPVIGAAWGGCIAYLYHWQEPFLIDALLAGVMAFLLPPMLKEVEILPVPRGFDWIGWLFYALGIFCLISALITSQQLDWYRSPTLIAATLVGIPCFAYYLLRSFCHEAPVLDLRFFSKPIFSLALLCLSVFFSTLFGMIVLLGIWLNLDVQFTPNWIAILLGMMGAIAIFPRFILEYRFGRIDPRIFIAIGTVILSISCFYTTLFNIEINFGRIIFSRFLSAIGLALFLPPIFQILSQCYAPTRWLMVFELFQTVRNLACALGAAIYSIIWERRHVFYYERLNESLSTQNEQVDLFFHKFDTLHLPGDKIAKLGALLEKQASALALEDVFYLMGWILAGLFVVLALTFVWKRDLFNIEQVKWTDN